MGDGTIVITGEENIKRASWLQARAMLKIRVRTGLKHSKFNEIRHANSITGKQDKNARQAWESMNAFIIEHMGQEFASTLE